MQRFRLTTLLGSICACLLAVHFGMSPLVNSIRHVVVETAPLADLARTLQSEVLAIQDDFTDLSATRNKDELAEKFSDADARRATIVKGLERFRTVAQREGDTAKLRRFDEITQALDGYCAAGRGMATAFVHQGTEGNRHAAQGHGVDGGPECLHRQDGSDQ